MARGPRGPYEVAVAARVARLGSMSTRICRLTVPQAARTGCLSTTPTPTSSTSSRWTRTPSRRRPDAGVGPDRGLRRAARARAKTRSPDASSQPCGPFRVEAGGGGSGEGVTWGTQPGEARPASGVQGATDGPHGRSPAA